MITVLTAVQKVKKNVTIKLLCWNEMLLIAAVFIAEVITGRSSKVITTTKKIKAKSPLQYYSHPDYRV